MNSSACDSHCAAAVGSKGSFEIHIVGTEDIEIQNGVK